MYEVIRIEGRVVGVRRADGAFLGGSIQNTDFVKWRNALPLEHRPDISDHPPAPPPVDPDLDSIDALITKDDAGTATNAEKIELVLRAVKRLRRRGVL